MNAFELADALQGSRPWLNETNVKNESAAELRRLYIENEALKARRELSTINAMVDRFLGWRLPDNFNPDGGITFKRESDYEHPKFGRTKYEPIGTNLFNADQAKEMFEYALGGSMPQGANVKLIAAAPDILESLIECSRIVDHHVIGCDAENAVSDARVAIAKAIGEEIE